MLLNIVYYSIMCCKGMLMFSVIFMKRLLGRLIYNISIKNRLLIYFLSMVILPATVICYTIYNKSTDIITKKVNASIKSDFQMIESDILLKFNNIYDLIKNIYLNHDVIKILSSDHPTSQTDIISEMNTIDKVLENNQIQDPGSNIIIPKLYIFNRPEYLMYSFTDKVSDAGLLEREKWYLNMPAEQKYKIVGLNQLTVSSVKVDTITIAKRLFGLSNTNLPYAGVLTIDVGVDGYNSILSSFKPSPNSTIFVLDENSNVILSPQKELLRKKMSDEPYISRIEKNQDGSYNSFIQKINGQELLISSKKINEINWTIVSLSPIRELNGELFDLNRNMIIVIIICAIAAFGMVLYLSDNISYPIRKLAKSMSTVQNGNFEINIEYRRNDEFRYLVTIYKEMVSRIKELIDKLYLSEVRKKEAELKSLQAQINPHFLYNTLDSINWMAVRNNVPEISTMVTSLSDFFRYSLSKGRDIITIEDEIKQVRSYLVIQSIRFKDKLEYDIDVPDEVMEYSIVKLVLQPIVENAIIHGIEKRKGKGKIEISGSKTDEIIEITIADNGIGADIDELNRVLNDSSNVSKSYGIKNVNERIMYTFGEEFGLKFESNVQGGVTATIRIPAKSKPKEVSNAANGNS